MQAEFLILVDENDTELGQMEKLEAHQKGLLHRAFSILIFNSNQEILLQQRAASKYHSPLLWTNTCCSHPRPKETIDVAAKRRLKEEMNLEVPLKNVFSFRYRAELDKNLIEHELDHVLFGFSDENPILNPEEAADFRWISLSDLKLEIQQNKSNFTQWFLILMNEHFEKIQTHIQKHSHESLS